MTLLRIGLLLACILTLCAVLLASIVDWRPLGEHAVIGYLVIGFGGVIALANVYLSFIRYPLYRFRGGQPDQYCSPSGVPLLGMVVVVGIWLVPRHYVASALVLGTLLIDTGNLLWFTAVSWSGLGKQAA